MEETETADNTGEKKWIQSDQISWAEEADEATKLEYSASDIEKFTFEKAAVVAKGEAAKDFKIGTNAGWRYIWGVTSVENIFL